MKIIGIICLLFSKFDFFFTNNTFAYHLLCYTFITKNEESMSSMYDIEEHDVSDLKKLKECIDQVERGLNNRIALIDKNNIYIGTYDKNIILSKMEEQEVTKIKFAVNASGTIIGAYL